MDIRPPAYRQHHPPLDSFRVAGGYPAILTDTLCRLQRALYGSISANLPAHRSIKAGVSGRYSVIPPVGISVLQINIVKLLSIF